MTPACADPISSESSVNVRCESLGVELDEPPPIVEPEDPPLLPDEAVEPPPIVEPEDPPLPPDEAVEPAPVVEPEDPPLLPDEAVELLPLVGCSGMKLTTVREAACEIHTPTSPIGRETT